VKKLEISINIQYLSAESYRSCVWPNPSLWSPGLSVSLTLQLNEEAASINRHREKREMQKRREGRRHRRRENMAWKRNEENMKRNDVENVFCITNVKKMAYLSTHCLSISQEILLKYWEEEMWGYFNEEEKLKKCQKAEKPLQPRELRSQWYLVETFMLREKREREKATWREVWLLREEADCLREAGLTPLWWSDREIILRCTYFVRESTSEAVWHCNSLTCQ